MKTIAITSLLLLIGLATQAQSTSCPVQPTLVKNIDSQISIDFRNTSGKQLASYRFGLIFFDLDGRAHSFTNPLKGNIPLKAQFHRTAIWQDRLSLKFLFPLAHAYLLQATFDDGTTWTDDGSQACGVTSGQE